MLLVGSIGQVAWIAGVVIAIVAVVVLTGWLQRRRSRVPLRILMTAMAVTLVALAIADDRWEGFITAAIFLSIGLRRPGTPVWYKGKSFYERVLIYFGLR